MGFTMAEAKKIYTLEEITFNEKNKTNAILACIPVIGLVMLFVEKEDLFVKYMGAQFTVILLGYVVLFIIAMIPVIGWILSLLVIPLFGLASFIAMIMAMVKTSKGERFDVPVASKYALKVMGMVG